MCSITHAVVVAVAVCCFSPKDGRESSWELEDKKLEDEEQHRDGGRTLDDICTYI